MKYIAWLDTSPGHIILFVFLILFGYLMAKTGNTAMGDKIVDLTLGALLYALKAGFKAYQGIEPTV